MHIFMIFQQPCFLKLKQTIEFKLMSFFYGFPKPSYWLIENKREKWNDNCHFKSKIDIQII